MRPLSVLISLFATCLLSACGAYFHDADALFDKHEEGTLPFGVWQGDEEVLQFADGPETHDLFCLTGDDATFTGKMAAIPMKAGVLLVASDITLLKADTPQVSSGSLLFGLAPFAPGEALQIYSPFSDIDEADLLPFATACEPAATSEGFRIPLSEWGYDAFCLNAETTAEDIATWMIDNPRGEDPLILIPANEEQAEACMPQIQTDTPL